MGNKQIKFQEKIIRDFEETTPFNRAEIAHTFSIFSDLYHEHTTQHPDALTSRPHIITGEGFANPECELPVDYIAENFTKLHSNPFSEQICNAFCTSYSGFMSFTEFIDMVSSFSPKADLEKKIFHAFQIFDFDHDHLLNRKDLYRMIDMMTQEETTQLDMDEKEKWQKTKEWIVNGVFCECHKGGDTADNDQMESTEDHPEQEGLLRSTGTVMDEEKIFRSKEALTIEDFRYCVYRSPDFRNTFSFNI